MWCVGHPWAYYWTGGSFGRTPWLFMLVAGLCAMKMGRAKLAGAGIVWAILLRVFPVALAGGLALKFAWNALRERRFDRQHGQIIAGAVAAAVLIGLLSGLSVGFESYSGFLANSVKHQSTPLTNHMGLRTLVAYDPRYTAGQFHSNEPDPYERWKEKRREIFDERILGFGALILGAFVLIGAFARKRPDWEVTSVSTLLLFGIFELTCYYFSYLVILAPFCVRRTRYAVALMAMAIGTQLSALWREQFDEISLLDSALVLLLLLYVTGDALRQQPQRESR